MVLLFAAACGGGDEAENDDGGPGSTFGSSEVASTSAGTVAAPSVAPVPAAENTVAPAEAPAPAADGTAALAEPPAPLPSVASLQGITLSATQISTVDLLTAMAWRPGDPDPYVADQNGVIYHVVGGSSEPVLDLTAKVMDWQPGAEYGFLAMTFDPRNGRLVVCYNGNDVHTRIESYAVGADGRPDPGAVWDILLIEKPGVGHNCGQLDFTEDNTLFFSHGDGGGSGGADAQDLTKLLGGIFRIAPSVDGPGYTIPTDNPYVGRDGIAPEIWAKGMRNPWRFSIDDATGDIWVGDVGESNWESVYRIPAGQSGVNCGWPTYEGGHEVNFGGGAHVPREWTIQPVHVYSHAEVGPAVIGGYVYRGAAIPQLEGAYIFADMSLPLFAMGADGVTPITVQVSAPVTSFGEGPTRELYVLTLHSGAYLLGPA